MSILPKVQPGQRIRAADFNRIVETVNNGTGALAGYGPANGLPALVALAQNLSGSYLQPRTPVVIRGQAISLSPECAQEAVLTVAIPEESDDLTKIAVVLDGIPGFTLDEDENPVYSLGRVTIAGLAWTATDGSIGAWGSIAVGAQALSLNVTGAVDVLWPGGSNIALVRLGGGGGGTTGAANWYFRTDV